MVRDQIGPVAAFKTATVVKRLPKTRSGKILRGTMQKIADGEAYEDAGHHRRPGDPRRDHARRCEDIGYASAQAKEAQPTAGE